jgi:hypothetical protein
MAAAGDVMSRVPAPALAGAGNSARAPDPVPGRIIAARDHRPHGVRLAARAADRWGWLTNTYWYVPTPNLSAVILSRNDPMHPVLVPVRDQTVFHVTGYRSGYFWGISVSQFNNGTPTCNSLVGSITPEGRVLLLFSPMENSSGATITQGIGQMIHTGGRWTMENQMFSRPSSSPLEVGHWAYMVPTGPGRPGWTSLPSAGVSVEQLLANCTGQPPNPVGPPA